MTIRIAMIATLAIVNGLWVRTELAIANGAEPSPAVETTTAPHQSSAEPGLGNRPSATNQFPAAKKPAGVPVRVMVVQPAMVNYETDGDPNSVSSSSSSSVSVFAAPD